MSNLLLHICCGPCAIHPVAELAKEDDLMMVGYYYNPNIHPYLEWVRRKEALEKFAATAKLEVVYDLGYQLEEFLRMAAGNEDRRCRFCYAMRLEQTAKAAKDGGFDCFSTTLLVSPYQDHQLIKETGEAAGEKFGVAFYNRDFREGYRDGVRSSRELGLYRQPYCGCIYSEKERYYVRGEK